MSKLTAADFIAALQATGGLIAPAARRLKVNRQTVYRATQKYPTVQQALDDTRADLLDLCESNVFKAASEGDLPTAKWLLERLGHDRGYVVRAKIDAPTLDARSVAAMSDEELNERCRELGID